jgi:hypothetical protein
VSILGLLLAIIRDGTLKLSISFRGPFGKVLEEVDEFRGDLFQEYNYGKP